jgi:hypothetical protein
MTRPLALAVGVACVALGLLLSGCAGTLRSAGSVLTTKENLESGRLVPQETFSLQDIICFHVDVTWDDITQDAGFRDMKWNWYKDGKLVAHFENDHAYFRGAPNARVQMQPASGLGVGHFRVECVADNKLIASAEFDIKGS